MRKSRRPGSDVQWNCRPAIEGLESRRLLSGSLGHALNLLGGIFPGLGIPTGGDFHFGHNRYTVGTVVSVDTTADTITVSDPVGKSSSPTTYNLASNATITADGNTVTLGALSAGAQVALQLSTSNSTTTVTSITAISQHAGGIVSSVDTTADTITVTGLDGNNTTYTLSPTATVTLNGSTSTLGDVTAASVVQLTLSALDGKTVNSISAYSLSPFLGHHGSNHQVSATVVSVNTTSDTITVSTGQNGSSTQTTYTVDPSATITANGATTALSTLLAGAHVQLTVSSTSSTTVTAVAAVSPHVSGSVSSADTTADTITLNVHGTATPYTLGTGATITIDGVTGTLAEITSGSQAQLTLSAFDGTTVTSVNDHAAGGKVNHSAEVNGTVVSVDSTTGTITVSTTSHGTATQSTYTLESGATITAGGSTTTLGMLEAGAQVVLTLSASSSTTVTSITAIAESAQGTVTSVDTTGDTITITASGGASTTYTLGSGATITLNGATSTLAALVAGTRVHLELSALDGSTVTSIQGNTPKIIVRHHRAVGTVTAIDTTADTITITNPFSGSTTTTTTYTVGAGATISGNGATATLADLSAARVALQLTTTGTTTTATSITALPQSARGVVSSVDTMANTITITPADGGTAQTYTLGTGATVTLDGAASTLASLTTGLHVVLQLSALDPKTVLSIRAH